MIAPNPRMVDMLFIPRTYPADGTLLRLLVSPNLNPEPADTDRDPGDECGCEDCQVSPRFS